MLSSLLTAEEYRRLKVWVLAPSLVTNDPNIDYYYDFTQSIEEYTRVFAALNIHWQWQPVTMEDYGTIISTIVGEKQRDTSFPIVLNLCDGDEINGTPGISVVQLLESSGLIYTGADEYFYRITTSKIPMKEAFDASGVSTAPWKSILKPEDATQEIIEALGSPLIVKPSVSGGSMGVGIRNVVSNQEELKEQVIQMFKGYRGWNLSAEGMIAEQFIEGPEFTTMIVGSWYDPVQCTVYDAVERVFHSSLPEKEKFLSFDRLWEIYEEESPMPSNENFYEYQKASDSIQDQIQSMSLAAFLAVKGTGYTRVDIRQDATTGKLYVLEVNAQCGLSEDEDYTSIGAILKVNNESFTTLIQTILTEAVKRYQLKQAEKNQRAPVYAGY